MADIEKIEQELRDTLTDAETPRGFSWENRYHANPAISSCDRLFIARCSPDNIRALLDELSRLREVERRAKELANAFYVFTIEDDEGIRLSTGGMVVAHYSEHTPEGIALLRLDAASRVLSERKEGQGNG